MSREFITSRNFWHTTAESTILQNINGCIFFTVVVNKNYEYRFKLIRVIEDESVDIFVDMV